MKWSWIFVAALSACGVDWESEQGLDIPLDREYGKPVLKVLPEEHRSVGFEHWGPKSDIDPSLAVWDAPNRWYQVTDEAGPAWSANSGLTWDQKYAAWVDSLKEIATDDGYVSVEITNPWGHTLPSPRLECAEMAMFLRVTFAAWYELPFFLTAYHPTAGALHYGHFGMVDASGNRVSGAPTFGTSYMDYSKSVEDGGEWPTDAKLAARYLTTLKDDANPFLGEDAYAGAYLDKLHANKRVGWFLLRLLTNFGSMHLASSHNTFNTTATDFREGDILIERWQRQGIGHVMVVKEVDPLESGNVEAEIIFGSMPRIQPRWYDPGRSRSYFLSPTAGGKEESTDGVPYSHLGGGLKRWRTPVDKGGHWVNIVPVKDRETAYIGSTDYSELEERVEILKGRLGEMSWQETRDLLLVNVDEARTNLRQRPASCANRKRREEAFTELYEVLGEHDGLTPAKIDQEYRRFEDYVFAQLVYSESKTCCWNRSTAAMAEMVLEYNHIEFNAAEEREECVDPTVFKAYDGGYNVFQTYADSIGRGSEWVAWSEDESCPSASSTEDDLEAAPPWSTFCDIADDIMVTAAEDTGCGSLTFEGDCNGNVVEWCDNGEVRTHDCDLSDQTCGYVDYHGYYWCD